MRTIVTNKQLKSVGRAIIGVLALATLIMAIGVELWPMVRADDAPAGASLVTDRSDYPPGSTVSIIGGGFLPGETVALQVLHADGIDDDLTSPAHQPWQVTADANGDFLTTWLVPADEDELGALLQLTGVGLSSGLTAQMTFHDGPANADNVQGWLNKPPGSWGGTGNGQNSTWQEGDTVPFQLSIMNMTGGTTHTVLLSFDFVYSGGLKHFYDSLNTYNATANVDPTIGVSGLGSPTTFPIPADSTLGTGIQPSGGVFTLYNISSMSIGSYSMDGPGLMKVLPVTFTVAGTGSVNVVIAFGGHLAKPSDWGAGNGASSYPGASGKLVDSLDSGAAKNFSLNPNAISSTTQAGATTTAISAPTVTYGANGSVTVTVSSAGGTPTGSIALSVDGGTPVSVALVGGSATFTVTNPSAGNHSLSASYTPTGIFTASSATGTLTVSKANATISVTPYSTTYDGNAHTATGSATGVKGETLAGLDLSGTTHMNAGTTTDSWTFTDSTGNYKSTSGTVSDSISQASSTTVVTINGGPFTYTGAAQTPATVSVTGAGGLSLTPTPSYLNNLNAGTATASYSYAGDANHASSSDSKTFAIGQATSTTTTVGDGPFTYDTTTHAGGSGTVTGAGGLSTSATSLTYSGDQVNAGTYYVTAHYAGDANHSPSDGVAVGIAIGKASSTTVVTINGGPFTYTGVAQTPATVSVTSAGGLSLTPTPSYLNNVDAGTATASYTYAGDANHASSSDSKTFAIGQAPSTTTTVGDGPFTYDTTTHAGGSGTVTGAGGLSTSATSLTYTGDQVNAGTYYVTAHYAGDANHSPSDGAAVGIVIGKASSTTVVTINGGPFTYTGAAQTPATVSVTGAGGLSLTPTASYLDNLNAGTATASYSFPGDANHASSSDSQTFVIGQAASTTTTVGDGPFTYDANTHAGGSGTVTGVGGLSTSATSLTYTGDQVNAGTYYVTAHYAGDANHSPSDGAAVGIAIGKASSTTVVTVNGAPFTYTGVAQTPATVSVTGAGGLSLTPTASYFNNLNAGTATASYAFAGDANHTGSSDSQTFAIGKASSTTVVTINGGPFTYTGAAQTPATVSVTGAGALSLTPTPSYAGNLNAGTATAGYAYAGDANHTGSSDSKTFVINQAKATVTANNKTRTYGAANPALDAAVTGAVANETLAYSLSTGATTGSGVGSYTITVTLGSNPNYNVTPVNGALTITPSVTSVAVTVSPASQQYSDSVTFTATVSPGSGPASQLAGTVVLKVNGQTMGSAPLVSGSATFSSALLETLSNAMKPGAGTAEADFVSSNANFSNGAGTTSLAITPEDAIVTYTGSMFVATPTTTATTATVTLSATIQDITAVYPASDANSGDIRKATVTFIVDNVAQPPLNVGLVNAADAKTGTVTMNLTLGLGDHTVTVKVGGYYQNANLVGNDGYAVVEVAQTGLGMITGGGYLIAANSGGLCPAAVGTKNNFGFNVQNTKTGLKGSFNTIVRNNGRLYQIKGNAMTSLTVDPSVSTKHPYPTAAFACKANIQDITDPLNIVSIDGNASLQATMTDRGEPGSSDSCAFTLYNKAGGVWFSSNWTGTQTAEQTISGGNLVVH